VARNDRLPLRAWREPSTHPYDDYKRRGRFMNVAFLLERWLMPRPRRLILAAAIDRHCSTGRNQPHSDVRLLSIAPCPSLLLQ
jgi:hypothetical protein